ncbi:MAG: 50S ribosomal protein L25/general stress protein Ctc [Maricaulis sp.]|jgi:large subunit ribosomal protein L25|uniref:50S ribosomal protein L25/general stress protein Ctc n=1 Tax=Maricaulis sp. TaxID=1486257 RepID=UPI001B127758|nr:50S ribosomal protein L25/general stress protein Ctc [Maricaulis sp.]MBO6730688.1 50S ribosomal protein L25/general stress protein Ctc [Maricaulis sp.]MBO6847446.1 50S ribosomal protein L25/general stress protein Ctc [Maricaulis sp.]MBO6877016.1 50S ribosomal protein L25/general stress protein Ctc [Maricaulis sp.]MDM7985385.1 50S ribosomal protein L25/general stress protein Ctc [Maricaulis sp.]
MSSNIVLTVDVREGTGTGAARAARREDLVPGVLYGGKLDPVAINLRGNEVRKALLTGNFISSMMELDHEGKRQQVIARDVQFHPVSDQVMHVDLFRVDEDTKINVEVAVRFVNESDSPGMKRGGVLNVVRHSVELVVPAGNIPDAIEADLTGLDIGDSVHISAIKLPEGAKPAIADRDFTVATLQGSRAVLTADEEEGADVAADAVEATEQKSDED